MFANWQLDHCVCILQYSESGLKKYSLDPNQEDFEDQYEEQKLYSVFSMKSSQVLEQVTESDMYFSGYKVQYKNSDIQEINILKLILISISWRHFSSSYNLIPIVLGSSTAASWISLPNNYIR